MDATSESPSPPQPVDQFDVVKAAEALLESAKAFASAVQAGNLSKPAEDEMRRSVAGAAKKIAAETLSPTDLAKSEYVVVSDACHRLLSCWAHAPPPPDGRPWRLQHPHGMEGL